MRTWSVRIIGAAIMSAAVLGGCPVDDLDGIFDPTPEDPGDVVAGMTILRFDNSGFEAGVANLAESDFSLSGATWSGGMVAAIYRPSLLASGSYAYRVKNHPAQVEFDEPVASVRFFYVHGAGVKPGFATAFGADGSELGSVRSNSDTFHADPDNFVTLEFDAPISRIEFSSGIIDNFTY